MKKINRGMRLVSMVMALVMALAAGALSFPASARAAIFQAYNWSDLQSALTQAQTADAILISSDFALEGDLTIDSAIQIRIGDGVTLSTDSYSITNYSGDLIIDPLGALEIDTGGSFTNWSSIHNSGTINNGGTIDNSGKINNEASSTYTGNPVTGKVPPTITTASVNNGQVGSSYSQTFTATGDTPLTWSIDSGNLPDGLTLSGATLSGTPTTAGNYSFVLMASNDAGYFRHSFSMTIAAATPVTSGAITITAPVTGATPNSFADLSSGASFYILGNTVNWSPSATSFAGNTIYTASMTLYAFSGYTFDGLISSMITINGNPASIDYNDGVRVNISYAFPATVSYSPTLNLVASPPVGQTYPGAVDITATLAGAYGGVSGKNISLNVDGSPVGQAATDASGIASFDLTDLDAGMHNFSANFPGDSFNNSVTQNLTGYNVDKGTQASLSITGVPSPLSYGDNDFTLSTSGGSGTGYVSFSVPAGNGVLSVDPTTDVATILGAGTVKVTATKASDGNYLETSASLDITVAPRDIALATVTLTGAPFTFTGSAIKPAYSVADGALAISSSDYTVSYDNNIDVGTATLTLTGQGNYTDTKQVSFDIVNTPAMDEVISDINNLPGANSSNPVGDWNDADKVADAAKAYDKLSPEEKAQIPQSVKDALDAAKKQAGDANKADVAHSASVAGNLPWNVRLVITPIASTETSYTSFLAKLAGKNLLVLDNIKLIDTLTDQEYVLPSGQSVEVTLGGLSLSGSHIAIAHQTAAGLLESLTATVSGDSVSFAASSFSLYGVTSDEALIPVKKPGTKTKAVTPVAPLAPLATPDTGDRSTLSDSLWIGAALLLSAGIALVIRRKRYVV